MSVDPVTDSESGEGSWGYCLLGDNRSDPDFLEMCRGRLLLPLDLEAQAFCVDHGLRFRVSDVFDDAELSEIIFPEVVGVLTRCQGDRELFEGWSERWEGEVNPLFVVFHSLVSLFGGTILKLRHLGRLVAEAEATSALLLEGSLCERGEVPVVFYGELVGVLYPEIWAWSESVGGKEFRRVSRPTGVDRLRPLRELRNSLRSWGLNAFCVLKGWRRLVTVGRGCPRWELLSDSPHLERIIRDWDPGRHPFSLRVVDAGPATRPAERVRRRYLEEALPEVADRVWSLAENLCERHQFHALVRHLYGIYRRDLEIPLQWLGDPPARRVVAGPGDVIVVKLLMNLYRRAFVYRSYLYGKRVVHQMYSDGIHMGYVKMALYQYASAPISGLDLFLDSVVEKPYQDYCGEVPGPVARPKTLAISIPEISREERFPGGRRIGPLRNIYYLPTAFQHLTRIGTSREVHDLKYWEIQKSIIKELARHDGVEVIYKAHPKVALDCRLQDFQVREIEKLGAFIQYRNFNQCLPEVDLLVADYFASGVSVAVSRGIPTLYLDFHIRRFFPETRSKLQEEIYWIDCRSSGESWREALYELIVALRASPERMVKPRSPRRVAELNYVDALISGLGQ
ncbi:MAG: hypothetical protein HQL57_03120 [Magnetococcales bacterium]|nr:hypothetical protein [Magnetococcales bacterium]